MIFSIDGQFFNTESRGQKLNIQALGPGCSHRLHVDKNGKLIFNQGISLFLRGKNQLIQKFTKLFLWAFIVISATSCQSHGPAAPEQIAASARDVVGVDHERQLASAEQSEMDITLGEMLKDAVSRKGTKTHTDYLDRQLNIYLRAEYQMVRFEKNLNDILQQQNSDPNFVSNPLEHDSYSKLILFWRISHEELHKIAYFYDRLLSLAKDYTVADKKREAANKILTEMHTWLESRTDAEKTQLIELTQELREVKDSQDRRTSSNDSGEKRRVPSAELYNFGGYQFLQKENLNAVFKKEKNTIRRLAEASLNVKNPWLDGLQDYKIQFSDSRKPSSNNPAIPDPGPDGNFFGLGCPVGTFVLTFDDGPRPISTERLLGYLAGYSDRVNPKYPATFFVLLKNVRQFPDTVKKEQAAGFGVHDHSLTHPDLHAVSHDQRVIEVVNTIPELTRFLGHDYEFFRCPYGSCVAPAVPEVRQMIADAHLIHAHWSIDSLDWKNIGQPDRTYELILGQMKAVKRGTILMHDIHDSSVDAAKKVFDYIKQQNDSGAQTIKLLSLEQAVSNYNASIKK